MGWEAGERLGAGILASIGVGAEKAGAGVEEATYYSARLLLGEADGLRRVPFRCRLSFRGAHGTGLGNSQKGMGAETQNALGARGPSLHGPACLPEASSAPTTKRTKIRRLEISFRRLYNQQRNARGQTLAACLSSSRARRHRPPPPSITPSVEVKLVSTPLSLRPSPP
jgi:hypothetical protein